MSACAPRRQRWLFSLFSPLCVYYVLCRRWWRRRRRSLLPRENAFRAEKGGNRLLQLCNQPLFWATRGQIFTRRIRGGERKAARRPQMFKRNQLYVYFLLLRAFKFLVSFLFLLSGFLFLGRLFPVLQTWFLTCSSELRFFFSKFKSIVTGVMKIKKKSFARC